MEYRIPGIKFLVLGTVFLIFNRAVAAAFLWLNEKVWDESTRRRFPFMTPPGRSSARPAAVVLGLSWVAGGIWLLFRTSWRRL